jgi:hypothetical protein
LRQANLSTTALFDLLFADSYDLPVIKPSLHETGGRHGVLLLVHQESRSKGWKDKTIGKYLSFPEVVARLTMRAAAISGNGYDSPQPAVAILDVSSC